MYGNYLILYSQMCYLDTINEKNTYIFKGKYVLASWGEGEKC